MSFHGDWERGSEMGQDAMQGVPQVGQVSDTGFVNSSRGAQPLRGLLESLCFVIKSMAAAEGDVRTVLVLGTCALSVAEALREQSREAQGFDVESFSTALPSCHVWCGRAEVIARYDLVVCLGLSGRLNEEDCQSLISCICRSTDRIIFWPHAESMTTFLWPQTSSMSYWVQQFTDRGFSAALQDGLSDWHPCFLRFARKPADSILLDEMFAKVDQLVNRCAKLEEGQAKALKAIEGKDRIIADLTYQFLSVQQTIGWKILERLWRITAIVVPPGSVRRKVYSVIRRCAEIISRDGLRVFSDKLLYHFRQFLRGGKLQIRLRPVDQLQDRDAQYQVWLKQHVSSPRDLEGLKLAGTRFSYRPLISIVTPVYNTDPRWLRKAVDSVLAQIYPNWELCLANDASTTMPVKAILDDYAAKDPRIRVKHLSVNQGIAGASAEALSLATGEFVGLLDHDDELAPESLFEVVARLQDEPALDFIFSDEDKIASNDQLVEPFFKPGWNPSLLLSMNYIAHFSVFRRKLLLDVGGFRGGFDGSQDYDLILRVTERTSHIAHIPKVLYHWRKIHGSTASFNHAKPYADDKAKKALEEAVRRRAQEAEVETLWLGRYRVRYQLKSQPLVSIIIPFRDKGHLLRQCIESIEGKSTYPNYEIILLDNDSSEPETHDYLRGLSARCRVYRYPFPFNFSAINNFGVGHARGSYLLFLNNDTQVIDNQWIEAMLEQAQSDEVGAVGAKLLYPDGRIQHAGVVLGIGGIAGHAFKYERQDSLGYFDLVHTVRNCSAVTAACILVSKEKFEQVEGFDERLKVAFNDVDLCLRLQRRGYRIVYTPFATLYHYESASRGSLHPPEDEKLMWDRWGELIRKGDPYYNQNLTRTHENWSLRLEG